MSSLSTIVFEFAGADEFREFIGGLAGLKSREIKRTLFLLRTKLGFLAVLEVAFE